MTFSRYGKRFLMAAIGLSLFSFSCTDFLKGKPKTEKVIELKQDSMDCLKNVSLNLKNFMKSTSTNEEIDETFACIDSTLSQFQTRVEGRVEASAFTSDELVEIFDKFIKDSAVSHAAATDILALKAALLGGAPQKITKDEISDLKKFILLIKAEAKNLLPYMNLFNFKKANPAYSKATIRDGFAQLNLSLKNLLKVSKLSHSSYSYEDFKTFLIDLDFLTTDQTALLDLADKVNSLLSGSQGAINEDDRLVYIDNLTEVLRLYTVHAQGYIKFEISSSAQMNDALDFIQDIALLLENSLQFKKTNMISVDTIDPLLSHVLKKDILPLKITEPTALTFYKTVLVRAFETGLSGDVTGFAGIKKAHLNNLKREIAVYKIYIRFIDSIATGTERVKVPLIQQKLSSLRAEDSTDVLRNFDRDTQVTILRIVQELKDEYKKDPVLFNQKLLVISPTQVNWDQNWEDMARALYIKMLARELVIGWGNAPSAKELKNSFITKQGMVQWYAEFKNFGIETKGFDPRVENAGESSLVAANLFTRAGNGDDKVSYLEMTQNLAILMGNGESYRRMTVGNLNSHCNLPELDIYDLHWNNESCFDQDMQRNYKQYFSNLPYLRGYLEKLNEPQFKSFITAVIDLSRKEERNRGIRLETSDIKGMLTMLYFIESLYAKGDLNHNFTLSEAEIRAAYPVFKGFATSFAETSSKKQLDSFSGWEGWLYGLHCYTREDLIQSSFVFLAFNGRTPTTGDLNGFACLRGKPMINFTGEVDRARIINTFKVLKAVLGS